ncbi:MAG: hypothetical protein ACXW27_14590 [Allosphingosinicella sp.]
MMAGDSADGVILPVGMTDPEFADHPDGLHTYGVDTCIAVAYLNETRLCAGLLHNPGMSCTGGLEAFVADLRSSTSPTDVVRILLAGGNDEIDDDGADVAGDRAYVEKHVRTAFPGAIVEIAWLSGESCDVTVTTEPPAIRWAVEEIPEPAEDEDFF